MYNSLGRTGPTRYWTTDAINCYNRNCICKGCPMQNMLSSKCFMKASIIELVKKIGAPKRNGS